MDNSFRPGKFNSLKTIACSFATFDFSSFLIIKINYFYEKFFERGDKIRGVLLPPPFLSFDSTISSAPKKWLSSFLVYSLVANITWKTRKKNSKNSPVFLKQKLSKPTRKYQSL